MSKIVSNAPDLKVKQPSVDESLLLDEEVAGGEVESKKSGGPDEDEGEEGSDSDDDDDDDGVQITIGEITTVPSGYNRTPSYTRMAIGTGGKGSIPCVIKNMILCVCV